MLTSTIDRLRHPHAYTLDTAIPQDNLLSTIPSSLQPNTMGTHRRLGRDMFCGPDKWCGQHLRIRSREPA